MSRLRDKIAAPGVYPERLFCVPTTVGLKMFRKTDKRLSSTVHPHRCGVLLGLYINFSALSICF
nr:MAG TPA: hypothetical protein [Caudoviricetes sp.]